MHTVQCVLSLKPNFNLFGFQEMYFTHIFQLLLQYSAVRYNNDGSHETCELVCLKVKMTLKFKWVFVCVKHKMAFKIVKTFGQKDHLNFIYI